VRTYEPVPETDYVSRRLPHTLTGVSEDGLASLLFAEDGETPVLRSAIGGEELVDLRDLLTAAVTRPGHPAARTRGTKPRGTKP
jgi:hypothetical protein